MIERPEEQIRKGRGEALGKGIILSDMIAFLWMSIILFDMTVFMDVHMYKIYRIVLFKHAEISSL